MKNSTAANFIFILSFVFIFSASISAQTSGQTEIKEIEIYSKSLDTLTKNQKNSNLIFADVSDYTKNTPSLWRKFNSNKALEKFEKNTFSCYVANVWQKSGKTTIVKFIVSPPSGDWLQFVSHYFRADGTLAKAESTLNTINGNVSVVRDFYFDRSGKLLHKTARYYDADTKKPLNPKEVNFMDHETEIYKKTNKLPFAALL